MATANHRQHSRLEVPDTDIPSTSYSPPPSSSSSSNPNKKKWSNFLPILVGLVVIGEIAFLGRLDMVKNVDLVNSWADSFYHFTQTTSLVSSSSWSTEDAGSGQERASDHEDGCEAWLEKEDSVPYSRDFKKNPIFVHGGEEVLLSCIPALIFLVGPVKLIFYLQVRNVVF